MLSLANATLHSILQELPVQKRGGRRLLKLWKFLYFSLTKKKKKKKRKKKEESEEGKKKYDLSFTSHFSINHQKNHEYIYSDRRTTWPPIKISTLPDFHPFPPFISFLFFFFDDFISPFLLSPRYCSFYFLPLDLSINGFDAGIVLHMHARSRKYVVTMFGWTVQWRNINFYLFASFLF